MTGGAAAQYGNPGVVPTVLAALEAAGMGSRRLDVDELASLDEFHTAGLPATVALAEAASPPRGARVLDVGSGLGGPARVLAAHYGCTVTALDLTPEYCELSRILNERTGLSDRVSVVEGDALDLPFDDGSFDVVWTQHASMNLEDKPRLYAGLRSVLGPSGTLALWDIVAGNGEPLDYPVPWSDDGRISFLLPFDELRHTIEAAGFEERFVQDGTEEAREFFATTAAQLAAEGPPPLGLPIIIPNAAEKMSNLVANVETGRIRLLRAVYAVV